MKKLLDKISEGGGMRGVPVLSSVLCSLKVGSFKSIEYVQNFWSTNWGILEKVYRYNITVHGTVFTHVR